MRTSFLSRARSKCGLLAAALLTGSLCDLNAATDQTIYADSLQNGWMDYGWTTINYNNTSPVHSGSKSIAVTIAGAWHAIYIAHADFNSSPYTNLTFWIHGGASGGQRLKVQGHYSTNAGPDVVLPPLTANTWQPITVSLAALGIANRTDVNGFWIQDYTGGPQPTFYLDDIVLVASGVTPPTITLTAPADGSSYAAPASIALAASVTANGHSITKVQFLNGASVLGEDASAPYAYTWTNVSSGIYTLSARVVYDAGSVADSAPVNVTVTGTSPVTITVDAQRNRRPISPLIYGTCFGSSNQLKELNAPLNRWGGNSTTRYNWHLNADNRANDWYFQSIGYSSSTPGAEADTFIRNTKGAGAEPLLTIPMIGWMAKLGPGRSKLASYSIAKYGPQTGNDWQWMPDAGNGISVTNNTPITWNDPNDANFPTNSDFQQAWVRSLTNRWKASTNGGVRYYIMDNEHTLWHSTHRDVHPTGTTMREIRDKFFDYAGKVKAVDPNALVAAPEEWGWNGYLYSGFDLQYMDRTGDYNPAHFPDRSTNGGWDYMPWFLDQARQQAASTGQRLLDVFTLHIYPQGNGESGNDVSTTVQLQRNRSTRALWDTNYVDQSWINKIIKLIPRMRQWVDTYYPGTLIGITEYNWGAENHINGATAQADILGIFGREGLDLATRWTTPASSTPTFKAMKLYRNYDGNNSGFGETSIFASGPNPDQVAVFAAQRTADAALTLMVINKQLTSSAAATVTLTNFLPAGAAQVWQLTAANVITRLPDLSFTGRTFSNTVPAQSITLYVLPAGAPPPPPSLRADPPTGTNTFVLWLDGAAGHRYVIYSSDDLAGWTPFQTNTLTAPSLQLVLPTTAARRFYRAQWLP